MHSDQPVYELRYEREQARVVCAGVMRLHSAEYAAIAETLQQAAAEAGHELNLDLSGLTGLNSSGITMFGRFLLSLRGRKDLSVRILGARQVAWQQKSLPNLQLLLPSLELSWGD